MEEKNNQLSILENESNSSSDQLKAREKLQKAYLSTSIPPDELMSNFGLYMRGSVLVKFLVLNEIYQRIVQVPGWILEFGSWWGQNLVLFENLRAIYEPFNKTRKIVGFDTFDGYLGHGASDGTGEIIQDGTYKVGKDYYYNLDNLLKIHENCNVLGHQSNGHMLVKGDVKDTVEPFFEENRHAFIALAYFDMGLYEPTKIALETIKPHLLPGSLLVMDELTWEDAKGEALAFKEVFKDIDYSIEISKYTPMRAYVTIK